MSNQKPNTSNVVRQYLAERIAGGIDTQTAILLLIALPPTEDLYELRQKLVANLLPSANNWFRCTEASEIFGSLVALAMFDKEKIDGVYVAEAARLLTNLEVVPGGPYGTTFGGSPQLLTNSFIALFLQQQSVELPNLNRYLVRELKKITATTLAPYSEVTCYLLSQLQGLDKTPLTKYVSAGLRSKRHTNNLFLHYTLTRLDNSYTESETVTNTLRDFLDTIGQKPEALSAMALAAFLGISHLKAVNKEAKPKRLAVPSATNHLLLNQIYQAVATDFVLYEQPLRGLLETTALAVKQADKNQEISLLPHYFLDALVASKLKPKKNLVKELGKANILCWMAYTIYDDFLDDEGQAKYLSVANVAMRKSIDTYRQALRGKSADTLVSLLYDTMDQANAWELQNARFDVDGATVSIARLPNYGDLSILSRRASGHILGLLLLAHMEGFSSDQLQSLQTGLHHYLVARQLNDDIHDWADDLRLGHCTYVVARLLRAAKVKAGVYKHEILKQSLQAYFWKNGFSELSMATARHIQLSRQAFNSLGVLNQNSEFFGLLGSIEDSVNQSIKRYTQQRQFVKKYKQITAT